MNPSISNITHEQDDYHFTLAGINVSIANAIRRTILTDIPMCVIQTESEHNNQCEISVNTSRFHNEIVKQRLSCIPIHVSYEDLNLLPSTYELVIDVSNSGDKSVNVTTEDFRLRNKETGKFATKEQTRKIFPPDTITRDYIVLIMLRAKISDSIPGGHISLVAQFSVSTAQTNSSYNAVSKCAYKNTPDPVAIDAKWSEIKASNDAVTEFDKKNFYVLDAQRYFVKDSFDFVIQSVGVYENIEIVKLACHCLHDKFAALLQKIDTDSVPVNTSVSSMAHCFDIVLENEDYTIGKVIEFILYEKYYMDEKTLTYCGFKKFHPHDSHSIVRVAFNEKTERNAVLVALADACEQAKTVFSKIAAMF